MSPAGTSGICLKKLCFSAVRKHYDSANIRAVLDLPVHLIKDLLPHLTVCQLNELQPALNERGISTLPGWVALFLEMCGRKQVKASCTEEEAKHRVMKFLFTCVFYGFTNSFIRSNLAYLRSLSFLEAAAKCMRKFAIMNMQEPLRALTAEQRPLLKVLEECIHSVVVSQRFRLSKESQIPLYVLHRLLDHGVAKGLSVHGTCPRTLAWLLHGRGSRFTYAELGDLAKRWKPSGGGGGGGGGLHEGGQENEAPCKRLKLADEPSAKDDCGESDLGLDPQALCGMFSPCGGVSSSSSSSFSSTSSSSSSSSPCSRGHIECLEISECGVDCLRVLCVALPTFSDLHTLTVSTSATLTHSDVAALAAALQQLCCRSSGSLAHLSVCVLPDAELMETLLDAAPSVTTLHVEVQTAAQDQRCSPAPRVARCDAAEFRLKKFTVKLGGSQSDLDIFTSVLRRSPQLTSFSVTGLRLPAFTSPGRLLSALSEWNPLLVHLSLEDLNLSDCLPEILHLLRRCSLQELHLKDCRLLEKWSNKEESLQQLVAAVKASRDLHTLSLAHNRLAKNVCVLVELFTQDSPSSVRRLDLSSNFIQPADLMDFAKRFPKGPRSQPLTLDLSRNPWDRDSDTWNTALEELSTACHIQVEGWTSTNTMADYISNM